MYVSGKLGGWLQARDTIFRTLIWRFNPKGKNCKMEMLVKFFHYTVYLFSSFVHKLHTRQLSAPIHYYAIWHDLASFPAHEQKAEELLVHNVCACV